MFTEETQKYFKIVEEGTLEEYVGCKLRKLNKEELFMKQSNLIEKIERNFKEEISNTMVYQTPAGMNDLVIRPTANEMKICASKQSKYRNAFVFDQIFKLVIVIT